jgi:Fur family peroxide stress response transcriptional regulator
MDYIRLLQEHKLKVTPQRLEIVSILNKYGHVNIDSIYEKLKIKFPSLSLATIYKNINIMKDKLFLSELKIPNEKSVYELTKEQHSHIVCTQCKVIIDINLDLNQLENQIIKLSSFSLNESSIVFKGLCPKCKNKNN